MVDYNATLTLDRPATPDLADTLIDALEPYHPAVANNDYGNAEIILTLPATSIAQATNTALSVAGPALTQTNTTLTALTVCTTADFDRHLHQEPIPELLSVPEAATLLGVSRQAVLKRIKAGQLRHRHVGERTLVTTRSDVERLKTT